MKKKKSKFQGYEEWEDKVNFKDMKNGRIPHILHTIPYVFRIPNNYLVFSNFKFFEFIFH